MHRKTSSNKKGLHHGQLSVESKRTSWLRELNSAIRRGNEVLLTGGLQEVPQMKYTQTLPIGTAVKTAYGKGIVTRFRSTDGVSEVLIQWDSSGSMPPIKAYLQGSAMSPLPVPPSASAPGIAMTPLFLLRASAATPPVLRYVTLDRKHTA